MALGADRMSVLKLVLSGAFVPVVIGLGIGIPVTLFSGRVMASKLFGVTAHDPLVLLITTTALATAAFIAAVVPVRRASNTEPMTALRTE
jgi:ABC-type antimicrobial peptide transport system permease subunit